MRFFTNKVVTGDGTVKVLLYGIVCADGDTGKVVSELMELAAAYSEIDVHINSQGGDVFTGIAIYSALQNLDAKVTIYIDGLAASIAGVIALCGRPLYMNRFARLMLHRVSGGSFGTADELRAAADEAERMESSLAQMIAERCKMTAEEVKLKYFDGQEHWINAEEAKQMGLIDGIVEAASMPSPESTNEDIYNFTNRLLEPQNHENMALIDDLKKRSSFANCTTEEQMLQHIATMENQAAKVPALEAKVTELTNSLNENKKAAHSAFLNQAVAEGRLSKEQVPVFLNLMLSDEANTRAAVEAMPKRGTTKIEDILNPSGTGKTDLVNMSWDEIDKQERLAELKQNYPDLYQQKFNEKFNQ